MYEQILIIANRRSNWDQRRLGVPMNLIEGGVWCRVCTYAYVTVVIAMALIGFYVIMSAIAQVVMGIGIKLQVFRNPTDYDVLMPKNISAL